MLVAISAEAGSGKSTVANYLAVQYGFIVVALADEMKRICQRVYGFTREQLWGPSILRSMPVERYQHPCKVCHGLGRDDRSALSVPPCYVCKGTGFTHLTPRQVLQGLGDWGRTLYKDTWVDMTLRNIEALKSSEVMQYEPWCGVFEGKPHKPYEHFVIPDARYLNEMLAIRAKGGTLIRLKGIHQPMLTEFTGHSSEQEQKNIPDSVFDIVVVNDADLKTLFYRVSSALGL